ncbi:MAG: DUF2332 domain-containing protein [Alphaproteobacteria bacterium]|nr:DUF2332 domain-containing protein [Alphaproteobacteria bacterium]
MTDGTGNKLSMRPDYWRFFAGEAAKGGDCPLYEHISLAIAEDPQMQALTLPARIGQPPANMLFGAVHFALLGGVEHPLRRHYSHLLKPGESEAAIDAGIYGIFRDFVAAHRATIDPLIATRVTNTNEVRRCAYLRAGYAEIAARAGKPLHIIEIGPSAGLNLNWDRYAYRYENAAGVYSGGGDAGLTIDSAWRGAVPPPVPAQHPEVAHRIGLELNPVDLTSEADRRWLLALLWPGRRARIERMRKALAIAVAYIPPIRPGDALAALSGELDAVSAAHAAVVVHSMVTYQWNEPMWAQLDDTLRAASQDRRIYRLFSDRVAKTDAPDSNTLRLRIYEGGDTTEERLADVHHHGAWIEWLLT